MQLWEKLRYVFEDMRLIKAHIKIII